MRRKLAEERRNYFITHKKELDKLRKEMIDKKSQVVFQSVIEGAITNNPDCYKYTSSASQYFPSIIKENLTEEEVFVDLGAFTGDSIEEFLLSVNFKFKKIFAFEPDSSNMQTAKENFSDKRIEFYQNGVGNKSEVLYLVGADEATHCVTVENEYAEKVEIVRLDEVIKEKITYIKMEDIVEIPNYIRGLNLGYCFYMRHYWNCNGTDVVLFAI